MTLLIRQDHGPIAHLTLNAPERLNLLSDAMLAALQAEIDTLAQQADTRVVVLKGAGRAFCAGHDLKEIQSKRQAPDNGAAAMRDLFDRCTSVMLGLQRLPQPVIAQVHGLAAAAGCQLVASCDMAIADTATRFGVNGVNIGLFCSTPMVALTRVVPRKAAFEMLTTGRLIPASEAATLGLINRAVPAETLEAEVATLADTVAAKLATAVRIGKGAVSEQAQLPTDQAYALTGAAIVQNLLDRDTEEGIAAFLEKRDPDWR
jgi:enoyl-CoA hydratase/carnithine racemase